MIYAVINDQTNIVENTIVLDEGAIWTPPQGYYIIDITGTEVGIGWSYDPATQQFSPPPPPPEPETTDGSEPNVIG